MIRLRSARLAAVCGAMVLSAASIGCDPEDPAAPSIPPPAAPPPAPTAAALDGVASGTVADSPAPASDRDPAPTTRRAAE